jgi:hypothetical protein
MGFEDHRGMIWLQSKRLFEYFTENFHFNMMISSPQMTCKIIYFHYPNFFEIAIGIST